MYQSYEAAARSIVQKLRPTAKYNGFKRAVVECYLRENLPDKYRKASWEEMKKARDYKYIREEAEHYRPPFNPDLWEFYPKDREIVVMEIEEYSPVTRERFQIVQDWVGCTMDGWSEWDLVLIITNRFGLGWDPLIDTIESGKRFALRQLAENPIEWKRYRPGLATREAIDSAYRWRNWRFPESAEFIEVRNSMSLI